MATEADLDDIGGVDGAAEKSADRASTGFGILVDGLNAVGSVIIGLMMLMICADVASRNLLQRPISGVSELTAMAIVVIVFLSLASTLRHGRMSRADLFIDGFTLVKPRAGRFLQAIYHLAGTFVCGVIAWSTWPSFVRAWVRGDFVGTEGVFTVPTWPMRLAVIVGATVAAIQYLVFAIGFLRDAVRSDTAGVSARGTDQR